MIMSKETWNGLKMANIKLAYEQGYNKAIKDVEKRVRAELKQLSNIYISKYSLNRICKELKIKEEK